MPLSMSNSLSISRFVVDTFMVCNMCTINVWIKSFDSHSSVHVGFHMAETSGVNVRDGWEIVKRNQVIDIFVALGV